MIPSLRPTETRIISLSSVRPMEMICGACNQSTECGDAAASNLALSLTSDVRLPKILTWILEATGLLNASWKCCCVRVGTSADDRDFQMAIE